MNLGTVALKSVHRENFIPSTLGSEADVPSAIIVSHPRINRAPSRASITASDDYFSISDYASDLSILDESTTANRWKTPPQARSPDSPAPAKIQPETITSTNRVTRTKSKTTAPLVVRFTDREMETPHPADSSSQPSHRTREPRDRGGPTPGVDDTPYIRFAIEQLTRDEEVNALQRPGTASTASTYDVQRIVPDEGLGYYSHGAVATTRQPEEVESPMSRSRSTYSSSTRVHG
jgi:hypothetical protein